MDVYSDKLLDISQKYALLTWGYGLFTNQTPRVICELTQANGHLTAAGWLTQSGKDIIQERLHSKIMTSQIFALLPDKARKVIERQSNEYTWKDANGVDKKMDGMTITALILCRLCPHHKVDMYSEIGAVKKMTIAQFDNDINLFFDTIRSSKLQIDSKDPLVYTDDAFVHDIFAQLKNKILQLDFRSEFTSLKRCWQMGKEKISSQSLMDDASTYNTNLVASGNWKTQVNKHAQIIALTTQILELKKEASQVKTSTTSITPAPAPTVPGSSEFEQWRLVKVNNNEEFNKIEKDGKAFYWCNKHKYPTSETPGMYVAHKPTEHDAWQACKTALNDRRGKDRRDKAPTPASVPATTAPKPSVQPNASKLSLAKSLQKALMTTAGLTKDQFNKIWESCCNALGN